MLEGSGVRGQSRGRLPLDGGRGCRLYIRMTGTTWIEQLCRRCAAARLAAAALGLGVAVLLTSACGSPPNPHRVTLRSGQVIDASTRPQLDDRTGYYRFRDRADKDILLLPDEVTTIERL